MLLESVTREPETLKRHQVAKQACSSRRREQVSRHRLREDTRSLDAADQSPQISTFDPFLPFPSSTLTPTLSHLSNNSRRLPCHHAPRRHDHGGRHDSPRQNATVLFDDTERGEDATLTNVHVRGYRQTGDVAAGADEDIVADAEGIVGHLASALAHGRTNHAVGADDCAAGKDGVRNIGVDLKCLGLGLSLPADGDGSI